MIYEQFMNERQNKEGEYANNLQMPGLWNGDGV